MQRKQQTRSGHAPRRSVSTEHVDVCGGPRLGEAGKGRVVEGPRCCRFLHATGPSPLLLPRTLHKSRS